MKTIITTAAGKAITTNTEFRQLTQCTESGTKYVECFIDGKAVTLRKHWSYSGSDWSVYEGHGIENMQNTGKSLEMELIGEPTFWTNEEGTTNHEEYKWYEAEYGNYNVEFELN